MTREEAFEAWQSARDARALAVGKYIICLIAENPPDKQRIAFLWREVQATSAAESAAMKDYQQAGELPAKEGEKQ